MTINAIRDQDGNIIHACAVASFPLPQTHWVYGDMVEPVLLTDSELSDGLRLKIREAMKYTIQACTSQGSDTDFDPDAMCQTLECALFGTVSRELLSNP